MSTEEDKPQPKKGETAKSPAQTKAAVPQSKKSPPPKKEPSSEEEESEEEEEEEKNQKKPATPVKSSPAPKRVESPQVKKTGKKKR